MRQPNRFLSAWNICCKCGHISSVCQRRSSETIQSLRMSFRTSISWRRQALKSRSGYHVLTSSLIHIHSKVKDALEKCDEERLLYHPRLVGDNDTHRETMTEPGLKKTCLETRWRSKDWSHALYHRDATDGTSAAWLFLVSGSLSFRKLDGAPAQCHR